MTRAQIESQLRKDNPSTTDDAGERHYPGSDYYEAAIQRWADVIETVTTPIVTEISKLTLMERLVALDKWDLFKTILIQLPALEQDAWNLAQSIRSDHPLFPAHAGTFKSALSLTDEEFTALLTP